MSCYWDVICLDCNDEAGLYLNKDAESCMEVLQYADEIGSLDGFFSHDPWKFVFRIGCEGSEGGKIDPSWFAKHKDHMKHVASDSGIFYGDCNQHPKTGPGPHEIDGGKLCYLPAKHSGEHLFEEWVFPAMKEKWLARLTQVKASLRIRGQYYLAGYMWPAMAAKGLRPDGSPLSKDVRP